ncbi:hypothetical protein ACLF3G_04540 [Falsiroseomonas sp. HC035]|uniref:hypothetical protein n=1 Tax=Falsiroseomonas sp. HC035 TaxID=3390999 RepID=UPI003D311691
MRWCLPAGLALALAGCGQVADISGAVAGGGAALASSNPAVGYAVGIGVRAAVSAGVSEVMKRRQGAEQDALATVIGALEPGETRPWQIRHAIPIGNQQGEVRLVRVLDNALAQCREAAFSVTGDATPAAPRQWFLTTACRQPEGWKWAAAEPATSRWGALQ